MKKYRWVFHYPNKWRVDRFEGWFFGGWEDVTTFFEDDLSKGRERAETIIANEVKKAKHLPITTHYDENGRQIFEST